MRIACPSCEAVYDVPDAMLAAAPRAVRCARCGTEWTPSALPTPPAPPVRPPQPGPHPEPEVAPPATDISAVQPARGESKLSSYRPRADARLLAVEPGDERPPPQDDDDPVRGRRAALVGWVLSIVLLVALGTAAVAWRTQVMAAWPPSARVYAVLGLR